MWTNGHFQLTFDSGQMQSYHIRFTFGFGGLQLVNSVVAESRSQELECPQSTRDRRPIVMGPYMDPGLKIEFSTFCYAHSHYVASIRVKRDDDLSTGLTTARLTLNVTTTWIRAE